MSREAIAPLRSRQFSRLLFGMRSTLAVLLVCATSIARAEEASSPPGDEPRTGALPDAEVPSNVRNPKGSIVIGASLGIGIGKDRTVIAVGGHIGYAVVTGVVPGIRGLIISGDGVGGEVAGTLTLTPPIDFYAVPFALGEAGRRFDKLGGAWLYGGGGGFYLGDPESSVGLQVGWIFRRLVYETSSVDASGPMVALSIRF